MDKSLGIRKKEQSISLVDIAKRTTSTIEGNNYSDVVINDVSALSLAKEGSVSWLNNIKYKDQIKDTKASAIFITRDLLEKLPSNSIPVALVHPDPYYAFVSVMHIFYGDLKPNILSSSNPSGYISDKAKVGSNSIVSIGAVIEDNVTIGDNCYIGPNTVIHQGCVIGDNAYIGSNSSIQHTRVGSNVYIHTNVSIGQDGFGFVVSKKDKAILKVPHVMSVIIGDNVEIGSCCTIDRGSVNNTSIGSHTKLDNGCHIAHNVEIGNGCFLASGARLAGSVIVGNYVQIGGSSSIVNHVKIGDGAQIAGTSGVIRDVLPSKRMIGTPAIEESKFWRLQVMLKKFLKDI